MQLSGERLRSRSHQLVLQPPSYSESRVPVVYDALGAGGHFKPLSEAENYVLSLFKSGSVLTVAEIQQAVQDTLTPKDIVMILEKLRTEQLILAEGEQLHVNIKENSEKLEVYFSLTEACNLACHGCATGTDIIESPNSISLEKTKLTLRKLAKSAVKNNKKTLRIKFAGGEPLMKLGVITGVQTEIAQLTQEFGISIEQTVLTNGVLLTQERVKTLAAIPGVYVAVSLWGIGDENDIARSNKSKVSSYPAIINGLQLLEKYHIPYNLNHVITPWNAAAFPEFIRAVWDVESDEFIGKGWRETPFRVGFSFFRPQVKEQLKDLLRTGYGQMVNGIQEAFQVMHELLEKGQTIPDLSDLFDYLRFSYMAIRACGSGVNYLAVGPGTGPVDCHEKLSPTHTNSALINPGTIGVIEDMLTTANKRYAPEKSKLIGMNMQPPVQMNQAAWEVLSVHGGQGCPITSASEKGELGHPASTAEHLYEPLLNNLLYLVYFQQFLAK